ncbi:MAG: polyphosphate polymerase domain-containing protein [Chitinophagales bacterium]
MKDLQPHIDSFQGISLDELNAIKLMNRQDTKFFFHQKKLAKVLQDLRPFYNILEIENVRISSYENTYFDDENFLFYHTHQRGMLNRTKIRIRKYVESDISFMEVKKKTNKSRTVKTRRLLNKGEGDNSIENRNFVNENSDFTLDELTQKSNISFKRITLAHKNFEDRCTLDLMLNTSNDDNQHHFENLVIAELKQDRFKNSSDFLQVLKKHKIYPGSFSKYCFSMLKLHPDLKKNRFKPRLRKLEKTLHA